MKRVFTTLLYFIPVFLYSQDPFYINYRVEEGLPSSEIYDISSDVDNKIWISTDRGLSIYDGHNFKTITTKDGLAENTNFNIYKDDKNRFWFNGYNQSLSLYENEIFKSISHNILTSQHNSKQNATWLKNIFTKNEKEICCAAMESNSPSYFCFEYNDSLNTILNLKKNIIEDFNSTSGNLVQIGKKTVYFFKADNNKGSPYRSNIPIETKSHFYFNSYKSIFKKNKITGITSTYNLEVLIENIYLDKSNDLWVCTRKGLYHFSECNFDSNPKHYFKKNTISCFFQDFEGHFWVGTNEAGVFYVPSFEMKVVNLKETGNNKILSIGKLESEIVFGTTNSKILVLNENLEPKIIKIEDKIENSHIHKFEKWLSTNQLILNNGTIYNENTSKIEKGVEIYEAQSDNLMLRLKNGDFLRMYGSGQYFIAKENRRVSIPIWKYFSKPISNKMTCFTQAESEVIWLGTLNGLYKIEDYNYENPIEILDKNKKGLGRISHLNLDNNTLWITTIGNGVFYLNNKQIHQLNTSNGLTSNMINNLLISEDSLIWVASNKGIDVFRYHLNDSIFNYSLIRNINNSDGLVSNYVNDIAAWKGNIIAATNNGICFVQPNIIDKEYPVIYTSITKFINQDSICNINSTLEFEHNENYIFIGFNGISFQIGNENLKYRYRLLDGSIKSVNWFITSDRNVRYNDLNPGNYTFEVSTANKQGIWNTAPTKLSFEINPHFTDTNIFKILAISLLLLAILLLVYLNAKRIKEKLKKENELNEAHLKKQEAELAAIRSQMNPHFVYNSLNSIQNFIFRKDTIKANYYLTKFSRLIRQSLQLSRLDFISIKEELNFLQDYLELELMRFPDKFTFEFVYDDSLNQENIMIPSLLLQPIVENSVKHGFNNLKEEGKLWIQIELIEEATIRFSVTDNGAGGETESLLSNKSNKSNKNHQSLGNKLLENRIALLNKSVYDSKASFQINRRKEGYETIISLPIKYNQ